MNKKINYFGLLFLCIIISFASCVDSDDSSGIDEDWKYFNEKAFAELPISENATDTLYKILASPSNNGSVKWRASDSIVDVYPTKSLKIAPDGKAEYTDSVQVRYEGWYYTMDSTKVIFDSTENPVYGSTTNPNKVSKGFKISSVVDGWQTLLYDMTEGEEREVWIPWQLGYGATASSSGIPGYTTLRFRIKLMKIIQVPK